jgi:4-amino-4-deoxy-L-arabinose transferase-like glycosyltransferase
LDRLTAGVRPYLLLSLLCLILYGAGLAALPGMDRDESRFVQATRQMLETGDFVRIQFQGEMRAKKPVGAYWLQAASVSLFSDKESRALWPYRLPSALAAWAAVLMTFGFGRHLFGRDAALVGAGLLAGSLILVSEAHQAKTDAIMLASAVAAMGVLARLYLASQNAGPKPGLGLILAFWVAIGASILIKGPVVPAIVILAILALVIADRRAGWLVGLKPFAGILVAAAIAGPWFAAISQATGGEFVGQAVKQDLLPKLLGAHESHGGWPGTYLALAAVTLWPGSLLLWPSLVQAWRNRARPEIRFCLAWAGPAWLMFELVPTKLPHYPLPTYPAITLLIAAALTSAAPILAHKAAKLWYGVWVLIGLVLAGALVAAPIYLADGVWLPSLVAAAALAATSLWAASNAITGRLRHTALALGIAAMVAFPAVFGLVMPHLDGMFISRGAARLLAQHPHQGRVAVAGYAEPSLVFLLGTDTLLTDGANAARELARPGAVVLVAEKEDAAFGATAQGLGIAPVRLGTVAGFNYSRGKRTALSAYGTAP